MGFDVSIHILSLVLAVVHHDLLIKFDRNYLMSVRQCEVMLFVICFVAEGWNVVLLVDLNQFRTCTSRVEPIKLRCDALDSSIKSGGVYLYFLKVVTS